MNSMGESTSRDDNVAATTDRERAERNLWGRNRLVRALGWCCGRRFYTWEGWRNHRRSHHGRV